MHHNTPQRFEADTRAVHLENMLVGVIVAVAGPGMCYLSGLRSPLLLVGLALGGFIAGYGLYTLRNYYQAALAIEITGNSLIITKQRRQIQIPLAEIRKLTQRSQRGTFLMIDVRGQRRPLLVLMEGYSSEQIALMMEQIEGRRA